VHAVESHGRWLRRFVIPSLLLTTLVAVWSIAAGVAIYRVLGVTIGSVNGRPATLGDEIAFHGIDNAFCPVVLHCLLLLVLFVGRVPYRWWLVALFLVVVGTPVALFSGWRIARYLWTLNRGGVAWEGLLPQVLALALAWLAALALDAWLSRYRIVVVRRDDDRRSPCPRCGYELHASPSGLCPECGWVIPPSLRQGQTK